MEKLRKMSVEQVWIDSNYCTLHYSMFKDIIIGDSGVGKSCFMQRLSHAAFKLGQKIMIGVEYGSFIMKIEGET
jgi:Ras-related protein Rab-14